MTILYFILALLLFLGAVPIGIAIHQAIKRGGKPKPAFTKESVLKRIAIEYNEDERAAVFEMLDQWRRLGMAGMNEFFLAQIQLAILQIANGNVQVVMKYTSEKYFSEPNDPRDIIVEAGYG